MSPLPTRAQNDYLSFYLSGSNIVEAARPNRNKDHFDLLQNRLLRAEARIRKQLVDSLSQESDPEAVEALNWLKKNPIRWESDLQESDLEESDLEEPNWKSASLAEEVVRRYSGRTKATSPRVLKAGIFPLLSGPNWVLERTDDETLHLRELDFDQGRRRRASFPLPNDDRPGRFENLWVMFAPLGEWVRKHVRVRPSDTYGKVKLNVMFAIQDVLARLSDTKSPEVLDEIQRYRRIAEWDELVEFARR